jgi:hypothetical protein
MMFDTDVLIWTQKGNRFAATLIDETQERYVSLQTYLELLQGAKNKRELEHIKHFLVSFNFVILPLTPSIGQDAARYIEQYALSSGLRAGDAIIAATAIENNKILCTANIKHFRVIQELTLKVFKPV